VQRFCADFHIPECQYVEHPFITGTAWQPTAGVRRWPT
jgi:hypothetical protein